MIFKRLVIATTKRQFSSDIKYVQGQSPAPKIREYFYYIDHEGMVSVEGDKQPVVLNFIACGSLGLGFAEHFLGREVCLTHTKFEDSLNRK